MAKLPLACLACLLAIILETGVGLHATQEHEYSISTSREIKESIRSQLLENMDRLANQTAAEELRADLQSGQYKMTQIDVVTVNQIFSMLSISDPNCDRNGDGWISGSELKCLNKIWKFYVPKSNSHIIDESKAVDSGAGNQTEQDKASNSTSPQK